MKPKSTQVCIIGAGPCGLYALKHVKELHGFTGTIFERGDGFGGVWRYTSNKDQPDCSDPFPSPIYANLLMNTPTCIGQYLDYPWKEGTPMYPRKEDAFDYFKTFVKIHDLESDIKCKHEVISVEPLDPQNREGTQWTVKVKDWSLDDPVIKTRIFDKVIICTGNTIKHAVPDIPGLNNFDGLVINAAQFNKPEIFKGMRVLVLGGSASGIDLLTSISKFAQEVIFSKRPIPFVPKVLPPNVRDVPCVASATKNGFILEDGSEMDGIDAVVLCTGYDYVFDFLTPSCGIQVQGGKRINQVYRHIVNVKYPGMFFPGLCEYTSAFYCISIQVKWIAKVLEGSIILPPEETMLQEIQKELQDLADNAIPGNSPDKPHSLKNLQWDYYRTLAKEGSFKLLPWVEPVFNICIPRVFEDNGSFRQDTYEVIEGKVVQVNVSIYGKGSMETLSIGPLEDEGVQA